MKNLDYSRLTGRLGPASIVLGATVFMCGSTSFAHDVVGKVSLLTGAVTAKYENQPRCLLAAGSNVFLQDQLETQQDSFVVIKMNDSRKLTLKPFSHLNVRVYEHTKEQPAKPETGYAAMAKNGLRNVSELVGHSQPVTKEMVATTIGIRGMERNLKNCIGRDSVLDPVHQHAEAE